MVDERRERILELNKELRTISQVLQNIARAETQESSFQTKIAYECHHAYQEGVSKEDVTVPVPENPKDPENRSEHYSRLRSNLIDAKPGLETRKTELREQTIDCLDELLCDLRVDDETKKDQVIALKEALQLNFRGDLIAEVVDCSKGYPGKFKWDDDKKCVVLREDVEARRRNRFSASQKEKVKHRDNHVCVKCGSGSQLRVHHIIPVEDDGGGNVNNGATLCKSCHDSLHQWKSGYDEDYESISEFWSWVTKQDS